MPRRTHYTRLRHLETASGVCECRRALVLWCLKRIEAYERGELVMEPCPAGCAPEKRLVVVMRLSSWRNSHECTCPGCDPHKLRRPAVQEPVAEPRALPQPPQDGPEGQPEAQRAQEPTAGVPAAPVEAFHEPPARDQVVEVRRARVSVPVGGPTPQLGPEDVVGGPEPYGDCAIPWCGHPLQAHRSWTERLGCRYCGWPVTAHEGFDPAQAFGLPFASRRAMACGVYLSIRFDGGEHDGCNVEGCGCPGWRRNAPYVSERDEARRAALAEQARVRAGKAALLARLKAEHEERLQAEYEAARRSRREQEHNTPSGGPVYVEQG